jgi:hypothetical protein
MFDILEHPATTFRCIWIILEEMALVCAVVMDARMICSFNSGMGCILDDYEIFRIYAECMGRRGYEKHNGNRGEHIPEHIAVTK